MNLLFTVLNILGSALIKNHDNFFSNLVNSQLTTQKVCLWRNLLIPMGQTYHSILDNEKSLLKGQKFRTLKSCKNS
jgi:hypothetical protein